MAANLPQTVILVRHAERAGGMSADVGISEAGRCRAEALARMLVDAGVKHIYVSEVTRTQQTAQPRANRLAIRSEVVPAKDIDSLVAKVRTVSAGIKCQHFRRFCSSKEAPHWRGRGTHST